MSYRLPRLKMEDCLIIIGKKGPLRVLVNAHNILAEHIEFQASRIDRLERILQEIDNQRGRAR